MRLASTYSTGCMSGGSYRHLADSAYKSCVRASAAGQRERRRSGVSTRPHMSCSHRAQGRQDQALAAEIIYNDVNIVLQGIKLVKAAVAFDVLQESTAAFLEHSSCQT